jgi:hypothetical protein
MTDTDCTRLAGRERVEKLQQLEQEGLEIKSALGSHGGALAFAPMEKELANVRRCIHDLQGAAPAARAAPAVPARKKLPRAPARKRQKTEKRLKPEVGEEGEGNGVGAVCSMCKKGNPEYISTNSHRKLAPPVPVCGVECEAQYLQSKGLWVKAAAEEQEQADKKPARR